MGNNGVKGNEERKQKCPFLGEWCIGDACALHAYLFRNTTTGTQKVGVCGFEAMLTMLSEMNQREAQGKKAQVPKIQLPGQMFNRG